jgi:hypothetical protein
MKWKREGDVVPGGDVGGDYQISESWVIRYRAEEDPTRVVDVYFFGEVKTEAASEIPTGPYTITRMTEATICRDPQQPPGDTEVWSDSRYDELSEISTGGIPIKVLDETARGMAALHTPDLIGWDGTPEGWRA